MSYQIGDSLLVASLGVPPLFRKIKLSLERTFSNFFFVMGYRPFRVWYVQGLVTLFSLVRRSCTHWGRPTLAPAKSGEAFLKKFFFRIPPWVGRLRGFSLMGRF